MGLKSVLINMKNMDFKALAFPDVRIMQKLSMRMGKVTCKGTDRIVGIFRPHKRDNLTPMDCCSEIRGYNAENGTNLRLITHGTAYALLEDMFAGVFLRECSPFPLGTIVAYEAPGKELGAEVVLEYGKSKRLVFPAGTYMGSGSKNIALAAYGVTAGDFEQEGNETRITVPESRIVALEGFPECSGWCAIDKETGMPQQKENGQKGRPKFIVRSDSAYVGHACCGVGDKGNGLSFLFLNFDPGFPTGIVVEVPEADVPKFDAEPTNCLMVAPISEDECPSLHELVGIYRNLYPERR
jgi:hypothetical protein